MASHRGRPIAPIILKCRNGARLLIGSALAVAFVTGCAQPPNVVVDMQGKDPVQTNRDLAYCRNKMMSEISWGNLAARCMRDKGYTVLSAG